MLLDTEDRKRYLADIGPVIGVLRVYADLFFYAGGAYSQAAGALVDLHAVQVVGYDDADGGWLCTNSWGAGWGEGGSFLLRIRYGECGLDSPYPFWGISGIRLAGK